MVDNGDRLMDRLSAHLTKLLEMYEEFPNLSGIKGKKYNRMLDNFTWDVRILRGHLDLLQSCRKDCQQGLAQVHSTAPTVDNFNNKDRSPSTARNQRKLNLFCKRQSIDTGAPTMRSPTSPIPADIKPKSILKKSNSNVEQPGKPLSPTNSARSNSWVSESMSREN
ncbi:hypothetical protein L9F63_020293 [Diploptera punctata]|uniref:Uncharacterized protein n=1 Tax=Diploptera punctata TaxID=6984 RepID=A0AAD8ED37_DIPPU|nr:hypothetical protein L9F63_020293 [Diploptera punctata]